MPVGGTGVFVRLGTIVEVNVACGVRMFVPVTVPGIDSTGFSFSDTISRASQSPDSNTTKPTSTGLPMANPASISVLLSIMTVFPPITQDSVPINSTSPVKCAISLSLLADSIQSATRDPSPRICPRTLTRSPRRQSLPNPRVGSTKKLKSPTVQVLPVIAAIAP